MGHHKNEVWSGFFQGLGSSSVQERKNTSIAITTTRNTQPVWPGTSADWLSVNRQSIPPPKLLGSYVVTQGSLFNTGSQ